MIMPVPLNPQQTFEAYKFNHPDWNKTGHLTCHECGGSVILRVREYGAVYAHICRTCGEKLYFTSANDVDNKRANEAFWRSTLAPPPQAKGLVEIKKKGGFRILHLFFTIVLLVNLSTMFFASTETAIAVFMASIHIALLVLCFKLIVGFFKLCRRFVRRGDSQ
jgi:hypothetical protein